MTYKEARTQRHNLARRISELQEEHHAATIDERDHDAREAASIIRNLRYQLDLLSNEMDRIAPEAWRNA